jgi:hypothetical protein
MVDQLMSYDPVLVETVERALEPYKRAYPPEIVEHFREEALMLLSMHPGASELAEQIRSPRAIKQGG